MFGLQRMAEQDLLRFLDKIAQLQALAAEIHRDPVRRAELAACSDHNQVVGLSRAWGYEIGRRWGESDNFGSDNDNLFRSVSPEPGSETERELASGNGWTLS